MDKRFDAPTVTAIVIGTIMIIITNYCLPGIYSFPLEWAVQVCAVVIVIISAQTGIIAGALMPAVASAIIGIAFMGPDVLIEFLLLELFGVSTGHYMEKLKIRRGEFKGMLILDFCMLEIMLAVLSWLCVYPLGSFYMYRLDLRDLLSMGMIHCGVSVLADLCICLPILLVFNRMFRQKRLVEDAQREYLYDRK